MQYSIPVLDEQVAAVEILSPARGPAAISSAGQVPVCWQGLADEGLWTAEQTSNPHP